MASAPPPTPCAELLEGVLRLLADRLVGMERRLQGGRQQGLSHRPSGGERPCGQKGLLAGERMLAEPPPLTAGGRWGARGLS